MRRPGSNAEYLFRDYDFFALQEHQWQAVDQAVASADADAIAAGDVDQLAKRFADQFSIDIPELIEGAVSLTVDEAQVDVTGDFRFGAFGRGPHYAPGIRASYYVPYSGETAMFKCKPTTWSSHVPTAELSKEELKFTFDRPDQDVAATKVSFDTELLQVKQNLEWLRENCKVFNLGLPARARNVLAARKSRLEKVSHGVQGLGVPIRRAAPVTQGISSVPRVKTTDRASKAAIERFDVALSFAGENRPYVEEVAVGLKAAGVSTFYDGFERADLWGKNLIDHLADIYGSRSRFVVMFISKEYVEKAWTSHERQHAQARALLAREEYILPARFDDTLVPGMTATVGFQDLRKTSPKELVDLILIKLRRA